MAWLATDRDGLEAIFEYEPYRYDENVWFCDGGSYVELPKGTIKKLINKELTWDEKPVEIK